MLIPSQKLIITFFQEVSFFIPANVWIFSARYIPWLFLLIIVIFIMYRTVTGIIERKDHLIRRIIFTVSTAGVIAFILQLFLKLIITHERPFLQGIYSFYEYGSFESFPSGHALVFMALAVAMFYIHRNIGFILIALAFIIGFARMIVGIHWPVDIISGWLLGYGTGRLAYIFFKKKR